MSSVLNSICMTLLTVALYALSTWLYRRVKNPVFSPIPVSLAILSLLVAFSPLEWKSYLDGTSVVVALLPLTVIVLALPLYRKLHLLGRHYKAILAGVIAGVLSSAGSLFGLGKAFGLDATILRSVLPKSITTPLGLTLCNSLDGLVGVAVISIVITGVLGVVVYLPVFWLFRIKHPIAKGVALGTAAHAIGTSKAVELGEEEGGMSSLALVLAGTITVAATPLWLWLVMIY